MRARTLAALLSGLFVGTTAPAQPTPVFEAASVKRNTSTPPRSIGFPRFQGTTFTATNVPVEMLIPVAYGVPSRDIFDLPQWIRLDMNGGERYDVIAKAAEASSVADQRAMLRHLLETRFGLRVRRETRQLPVYILTKLDERGPLGPNLRPPAKDCSPQTACEGRMTTGQYTYKGAQWSIVVDAIRSAVGGRMIDRTGLSGTYDFDLTYNAKGLSAAPGDSGIDLFGAVRQQLGLRLDAERAPFEIIVVESVKRPTPD